MCDIWKTGQHLKKCGTVSKMHQPWKNAPYLEKCVTVGKMRHNRKISPHLEKCATIAKKAPHLRKHEATLQKMR